MTSSEERIKAMFEQRLGIQADLDVSAADTGVSSLVLVEFLKQVAQSFDIEISAETAAEFATLRDLVSYVDSHAG